MDESKQSASDRPGLIQGIKARSAEFCVGLAAHYLRFLALALIFGVITLFALLFMDINDGRIAGSIILLVLNAFLLGSAMLGVGGLMVITLVEDRLVRSWTQPKETQPGA